MGGRDHLGEFEHLVLLAIARAGGTAGGARIHAELETVARRRASLPAIYVTIARLEKKGLLRAARVIAREEGGRPRQLFEITHAGTAAIHATRAALERMWIDLPVLDRSRR